MKPLQLTISGFTCFTQETSISFEDLGLFAIEGPTGSGKTSLLDAITYALYGKTERIGSKGLQALISPEQDQMLVQFTFELAEKSYRVTRSYNVKNKRPDSQLRLEVPHQTTWKALPDTDKIAEANKMLERIIGLDYDGFTRAILLPQGTFDSFLRGDAGKRRSLLRALLGLDRIESMRHEAFQIFKEAQQAFEHIDKRLREDFGDVSMERKRELQSRLAQLGQDKQRAQEKKELLSVQLDKLKVLKALVEEQQQLQQEQAQNQAQGDTIAKDQVRLDRARRAVLVMPQWRMLTSLEEKHARLRKSLNELEPQRAKAIHEQNQGKHVLEQAERAATHLPDIQKELENLASVAPLMQSLKARGGSLALAEQPSNRSYSEEAWTTWHTRQAKLPQIKRARQELSKAQQELAKCQRSHRETEQTLARLTEKKHTVTEQGKRAGADADKAEKLLREAERHNRAASLREHLHVGDKCPVCEQSIRHLPEREHTELDALEQNFKEQQEHVIQLRESWSQLNAEIKAAEQQLQRYGDQLKENQQEVDLRQQSLEDLLDGIDGGTQSEQQLEQERQALLASLARDISERSGGQNPEIRARNLQRERQTIETQRKTAEQQYQHLVSIREQLDTEIAFKREALAEVDAEHEAQQSSFAQALKDAGFERAEALQEAVLDGAEIERLAAAIEAYQHKRAQVEQRLASVEQSIAGRDFDEQNFKALEAEAKAVEQSLEQLQTDWGRSSRELEHVNEQLEKTKLLQSQKKEQIGRFDIYKQLSSDLKSDAFQDYILAKVQAELALRASHIIREVTEGRYDLRLFDGDYHVLDAWHGSELRNAKTLSGGETFIASLALALALSDTVAGHSSLGALFLDEGFGTLDSATLDSVAQVLETLASEGRMVGIITHVTALAERLPARLKVYKESGGSKLEWDL